MRRLTVTLDGGQAGQRKLSTLRKLLTNDDVVKEDGVIILTSNDVPTPIAVKVLEMADENDDTFISVAYDLHHEEVT